MRRYSWLISLLAILAFTAASFVSCGNNSSDGETVATPIATPGAGAVASGTTVVLSTTTIDADIWYTTDGSAPAKDSGDKYSNPISITAAVTIKAIAVKDGMNDSGILIAEYTIAAISDDAAIAAAKTAVEGAAYTAAQADVNTEEDAISAVEAIIGGLSLNGVTAVVVGGTFTEAVEGTFANPDGDDGSLTFTIKLDKGTGTQQTTISLTLTITATEFDPVVFSLAKWFATHPGIASISARSSTLSKDDPEDPDEIPGVNCGSHGPFRMNSGVPDSNYMYPDYDNGTMKMFIGGSSAGPHIQLDPKNLDLDITADKYSITIKGYYDHDIANTSGLELRLQTCVQGASGVQIPGGVASATDKKTGDTFSITCDIPNLAGVTSLRFTGSSGLVGTPGTKFHITDIVIEYLGPRE
jgi:hypothetical protein